MALERAGQSGLDAFPCPPHVRSPSGEMVGWYTTPPGVVMQFVRPMRAEAELARWLVGAGATTLFTRFHDERALVLVLDLRLMTGRDPGARALLLRAAPSMRHRFKELVLVPPSGLGSVAGMTLSAGASLLRTLGFHVEVDPDLPSVLQQKGLRPDTRSL